MLTYTEMLPHSTKPVDPQETRYEENTGGCLGCALAVAAVLGVFCGLMLVWVVLG